MVVVRTRMAVRVVLAVIRRRMVMVMPAALGRMIMDMVERQHTATEPGDHAEHQEP